MKKYLIYPSLALAGGALAFLLRLAQNRTGFEAATGLPIPGNLWGVLLPWLLAALAVLCLLLARRLPREAENTPEEFSAAFATHSVGILTALVSGLFLLGLSGLLELAAGLGITPESAEAAALGVSASRLSLLMGALTAAAAVCLFPAAAACRQAGTREATPAPRGAVSGNVLLAPVGILVVRLVAAYRQDSVNPTLAAYYIELLALVFLTLAFYRLSSFAFRPGQTRRFVLYALPAVALCLAALADSRPLYSRLFFAGCGLIMLGFLLLRLDVLSKSGDNI